MKSITVAIACCFMELAAAADGAPPPQCPSGGEWLTWRLTATPFAETPIFAGDRNTRIATVCNCTEPTPSADAGVWVATLQQDQTRAGRIFGRTLIGVQPLDQSGTAGQPPAPSPPEPPKPGPGEDFYYLQGGACTLVGPGSVILRTADARGVKWGVWKLEKP